jgi:putative oxidoreductase
MKIAARIANYVLAIPFLVLGFNHFLNFIPMPTMEGDAMAFMTLLSDSGYMAVIKVLEVVIAIMLLAQFKKELAYILVAPIIVNIMLFDFFIMGMPGMGVVLFAIDAFLIYAHRDKYMSIIS